MSAVTEGKAATTRTVLLSTLLLLVAALTGTSLFMVWHRMRQQVAADFTLELNQSAVAFKKSEAERLNALRREDDLLADLPSLKALMTTNDDHTIEDGALEFWRTSGDDLFALVASDLRVRAAYVRELPVGAQFRQELMASLQVHGREYLLSGGHLFRYAVSPVYFGSAASGTLLGYVVNGYAIDAAYLSDFSSKAEANRAFLTGDAVLASSTALPYTDAAFALRSVPSMQASPLLLNGERYLAVSRDLGTLSSAPLLLVFFKSLQAPEGEIREISRLLLIVGLCLVLIGSLVMALVARALTRPLENLTRRVRAYGSGQKRVSAPREGTREVRQLAADFETMQERIAQSNRARLESERLATIGSMASSVSHDLRHYLASIYANAEFMAAPDTSDRERAEFLDDVRIAVLGTTEMLESLMIIGRTGHSIRHAPERLDVLTQRAVTQLRTHPEAARVVITVLTEPGDTGVTADGKQLERALYNLLLNACQAALDGVERPAVTVTVSQLATVIAVRVTDNGPGVVPAVQATLFDPFVSQGKQNGTGLGLTLCRCIAEEHEGEVVLVSSVPGQTVFELRLPRIGDDAIGVDEAVSFSQESVI